MTGGSFDIPISLYRGLETTTFPAYLRGYMELEEWNALALKILKVADEYRQSERAFNNRSYMIMGVSVIAGLIIAATAGGGWIVFVVIPIFLLFITALIGHCVTDCISPQVKWTRKALQQIQQICTDSTTDQVSFHLLSSNRTVVTRNVGERGTYTTSSDYKDWFLSIVTTQQIPTQHFNKDVESQLPSTGEKTKKKKKKKKKKSVAPDQEEANQDPATRLGMLEQMKSMLSEEEYAQKKAEILTSV